MPHSKALNIIFTMFIGILNLNKGQYETFRTFKKHAKWIWLLIVAIVDQKFIFVFHRTWEIK